ncbi:hypothetical protein C0J52_24959 [Blattella germanica]|nr:hypothetical protein C0J52_24959 [Blattella germanica]
MYNSYMETTSCRQVKKLFMEKFPDVRAPHRGTVRNLVNRFRETGSVLDKTPKANNRVLTEKKIKEIEEKFRQNPGKSLSKLAQDTGVSQFTVWKVINHLKSEQKANASDKGMWLSFFLNSVR